MHPRSRLLIRLSSVGLRPLPPLRGTLTGFAIGAFFSLMSASFAYEDPMMRASLTTAQKTSEIFKEMGRNMWRSGKGFGKVGALFAGIECVLESVSRCCTRVPNVQCSY